MFYDWEKRRDAVLLMLRQHPEITRAFATDDETDRDYVLLTIGIRGTGTCELRIRRTEYNGMEVLRPIEEQSGDATMKAACLQDFCSCRSRNSRRRA